jgi:hypothetical protein
MANTFVTRWLTGLILVAVIFGIIVFAPPVGLVAVIVLVAVGGIWEYNNIVF